MTWPSHFLETIFHSQVLERGLEIELRCIHHLPDKPVVRRFYGSLSKFEQAWQEILNLNRQGFNVYFGVVPRDPKNDHKPVEPTILTCLWVDIDVGPDKPIKNLQLALNRVKTLQIKPTIVVKSGHGLHVYFCLKKPTEIDPRSARAMLRALAELTGGDLQSAEIARLLRLPNTVNWKGPKS